MVSSTLLIQTCLWLWNPQSILADARKVFDCESLRKYKKNKMNKTT